MLGMNYSNVWPPTAVKERSSCWCRLRIVYIFYMHKNLYDTEWEEQKQKKHDMYFKLSLCVTFWAQLLQ